MLCGLGGRRQDAGILFGGAIPKSLNPQVVTSVTGMNAAEPMFDGLVGFEAGGDAICRPRRVLGHLAGRDGIHVPSPAGREVPCQCRISRRRATVNADDVLFSFDRQWQEDNPFHHPAGGSFNYFEGHEHGDAPEVDRAARRLARSASV